MEEFEEKYSQVEDESKVRLQETEEAQLKAMQLQETIERYRLIIKVLITTKCAWPTLLYFHRLESNLSNLESENQVLRQQALVASMNEEVSEELTV